MFEVTINSTTMAELKNFLQTMKFTDKVFLVSNKDTSYFFFGEPPVPVEGVFLLNGSIHDGDLMVCLNVKQIIASIDSAVNTINLAFPDETYVEITIDGQTKINLSAVTPDEDTYEPVHESILGYINSLKTKNTETVDYTEMAEMVSHLVPADKAGAVNAIDILSLGRQVKFGSNSHLAIVTNSVFNNEDVSVTRYFLSCLKRITKTEDDITILVDTSDENMVFVKSKHTIFATTVMGVKFMEVGGILDSDAQSDVTFAPEQIASFNTEIDRLKIPLIGVQDPHIMFTVSDNSVNLYSKDLANRISTSNVPFDSVTKIIDEHIAVKLSSISNVIKDTLGDSVVFRIHESFVEIKYDHVSQIISRYIMV